MEGHHNFYEDLDESRMIVYDNPNFKKHKLVVPFRGIVVAGSGGGKTLLALDIIRKCNNTFDQIIVCAPSLDEPLYDLLREKIPANALFMYDSIDDVPELNSFTKADGQVLVIWDDWASTPEAQQKKIVDFYIRGRKSAKGISSLYLSQSYFKIPRLIRLQANYVFLKKVSSNRDIKSIVNDYSLGKDLKEIMKLYSAIVNKGVNHFMLIDLQVNDELKRFRHNYTTYV